LVLNQTRKNRKGYSNFKIPSGPNLLAAHLFLSFLLPTQPVPARYALVYFPYRGLAQLALAQCPPPVRQPSRSPTEPASSASERPSRSTEGNFSLFDSFQDFTSLIPFGDRIDRTPLCYDLMPKTPINRSLDAQFLKK
jgi:hypothetical protein